MELNSWIIGFICGVLATIGVPVFGFAVKVLIDSARECERENEMRRKGISRTSTVPVDGKENIFVVKENL